ncbi:TetR family transcriptional regulator [Litoreibacter meonggei]|uniref:TetR family transcriptional regulator n=1 Tax=Litoreibacter meonggei TaxID=1049199 RepID=A0A497VCL9_9RHOB|nr:TetR/AcrR family transcriptional regulator [Litoreibacter meonggei]RLJ41022.1 TetR family transcriptional regulator [Litoreibacter meonggei]
MKKSEATKAKLLESSGRAFRREGYAGIGVDSIAKDAGVTSGAFYSHLKSKNEAFCAALVAGLEEVLAALPAYREAHGDQWPAAFADYYLGQDHRLDLEGGCAMTSLTPEVVRAEAEVQTEYAAMMGRIVKEIAIHLPQTAAADQQEGRAWAFLSTLIGGLTLARAVGAGSAASEIERASKAAALEIIGFSAA